MPIVPNSQLPPKVPRTIFLGSTEHRIQYHNSSAAGSTRSKRAVIISAFNGGTLAQAYGTTYNNALDNAVVMWNRRQKEL